MNAHTLHNIVSIFMSNFDFQEVNKLRNEMVQMETAITERLGYLQRHKVIIFVIISEIQQNNALTPRYVTKI